MTPSLTPPPAPHNFFSRVASSASCASSRGSPLITDTPLPLRPATSRPTRLPVPPPPARPGQEPDFSYVQISPAGAVNRPDVTASVRDIENLALEMVRVLDEEHRAVGPWDPRLEASELQVGLRHMLLT